MDENQQDKPESKRTATENNLSPPSLSSQDHREPERPQNNRMGAIIKWIGFFGYDKETKEYSTTGQLTKITKERQPGKTFWDLLQLLVIPIILAGATIGFGLWQNHLADVQHQNDLKIAQGNRQNDLIIADDQQQEATLKTYLDDMTTLLLDKKLGSQAVADKTASDEAAIVGRAKTLTALRRLNAQRKATVIQFLHEARLIGYCNDPSCSKQFGPTIINLGGADLRGANLSYADLLSADLSGADLSGANLSYADLVDANLVDANMRGANLVGADLRGAYLFGADLRGANLDDIIFITQDQLDKVSSCKGAILPSGLICHHN